MNKLKRLFRPPTAALALIAVSATALLTACLDGAIDAPAAHYVAYLYSTYALIAVCFWLPGALKRVGRVASHRLTDIALRRPRFGKAYIIVTDAELRTRVLLVPSLVCNLCYAVFKLAAGFWLRSAWLIGVGAYYGILASLRYSLLRTFIRERAGADAERDWRTYRWTAIQLLFLTLVMSGLIAQMVFFGKAYHYPGAMIYAFALYAFVKIGVAAASLLRRRREDNRLLAASRCISLACAMMSMLALQTAMISQFGSDPDFARTVNALFGGAVWVVMLALCSVMLGRYRRHAQAVGGV